MRWFQYNHPGLYVKYWNLISEPNNSEKVSVSRHAIDAEDYKALIQIEYDYYSGRTE